MSPQLDETVLDDADALAAADPAGMLRAVATSGAQVREAVAVAQEAQVRRVADDGRPRALVVAGMGGSDISGDVLAAVAGAACPIPIVACRGFTLPGWVGSNDVVVAVSCSGSTEETLAAAEEAGRRGARLVTVGAEDSPLADLSQQLRAVHVPVAAAGRAPRATLWALSVPLLVLADSLGLVAVPAGTLAWVADELDRAAQRYGPSAETYANPAKVLALELGGSLPYLWGVGDLAGTAARRLSCQLHENAKYPAVADTLPEAQHNLIEALDGPFGAPTTRASEDFFRDRVEHGEGATRIRLVLLRDTDEHPALARRAEAIRQTVSEQGIPVSELRAEGEHALQRLASLVVLGDFASVYLALAYGIDPTPIPLISTLKRRASDWPAADQGGGRMSP